MRCRRQVPALVVPLACLVAWGVSRVGLARSDDLPGRKPEAPAARAERRADLGAMAWTTAVEPKALSPSVQKGLDWLVAHQLKSGGWDEGEGDAMMQVGATRGVASIRDTPNVADTCIASLALIRSGSTPREGPYRGAIVKGVRYVRSQVEVSDARSLAVSGQSNTRTQGKLGPNIDTYMASMLLAEVKGRMPDEASERAVDLALDKVIGKIERHLAEDGPFEFEGWAPVLALAMSAKGLNRARQAGARVSDVALGRVWDAARMAYTHGGWPVAYEVGGRTGHARTGHKASRRPRATDGVGSSRSMANVVDDEEAGHGNSPSAASPAPPSSPAGRAARDGESAGRRSLLGGASPVTPSPSVRDREDAGGRGLLAGAGPLPSSAAAAGEANDREDGDLRTEPSAGSPASPSHRASRRMTMSWTAVPPPAVGRRPTMRGMAVGVPLYGWSACLGILQDSLNTGRAQVPRLRDQAAHSRHPQERAEAKKKLARIAEAEQVQQEAQATVGARLDDRLFLGGVAGLGGLAGLNGGEEFLSYMNLAESLAVTGDEAWRRWDSGMTESLNRLQNADGSWTGSHCITGRTFCTAAVLLTLTADRTPVPVPARTTTSSYSR
jgi:hypothetical protein